MPLRESDPVCLACDPSTGDLLVPLRFASGLAAVVQGARTRILMSRGEWFADLDVGVPWFEGPTVDASEAILGQKFNRARVIVLLTAAVLRTPGVVEVTRMDAAYNGRTRTVAITWEARVEWGDTVADTLDHTIGGAS